MAAAVDESGRRLVGIEVEGLLDSFNHRVVFPQQWDFVILYGPNGVGKTKMLELTRAAVHLDIGPLAAIPFRSLVLSYSDGSRLGVRKTRVSIDEPARIDVELRGPEGTVSYTLSDDPTALAASWLTQQTAWRPLEGVLWRDDTDGEVVAFNELIDRFDLGSQFPRNTKTMRERMDTPRQLSSFGRSSPVHLIETQRLLALDGAARLRRSSAFGRQRGNVSWSRTVTQYSDHLRTQLAEALASNSRLGQQLDRTFPRRIMDTAMPLAVGEEEIRDKYETQNALRSRLSRFGLIEAEGDLPLPARQLDTLEIKALSIYLADTDRKLSTFRILLEKLELFVSLINERFARKTVSIDVNEGLRIIRKGSGEAIEAEALSSGEQHELVLVYDLLFRTPAGSTVLIDEPEISLHVAWQQMFIEDVSAIARLSDLRFVVATHSPQIIDKWWGQTSSLNLD